MYINDCIAVSLLDPKKVPEGRFLLNVMIEILIVLMDCLNSLKQADIMSGLMFRSFCLVEPIDESFPEFEVKVLRDFGTVNG